MNGNNVRTQNLRDFTVQIRRVDDDSIVGTGVAVSTDGKIVTCAHVIRAAGIEPRNANGAEVGVYFPQARGGDEKKHRATVDKCFPHHDDDIVLLQINGKTSPLGPEQIAVLGMANDSEGNPFRTYGYSPIGTYPAVRGDGTILGTIEPPIDRNLQTDPVQLKSRDIAAGMSGAAVLDVVRNLVVGLVAERFYSPGLVQDDIGFGVDSKVLTFDPFDFEIRGDSLALKPAPEFRLDKDLLEQAIQIGQYVLTHRPPEEKFSWNSAPSVLTEWTGRDDLLKQITEDWNNPGKHVTGLIGFGGEGKSSLARKWVETIITSDVRPSTFDGVFWWGFYENRSVDEFLEAALKYMSGGRIDPRQVQSSNLRAQIIGAMLGTGRYLFVLDGLEVMQHQEGDQYGLLQSNDLRDLLTFFARPDNQSFCLITSRAPLLDLMEYTTYTHRDVDRLSEEDGRALLRRLGVKGSDVELNQVVSDWDGHALTLSILAAYLAERFDGDIHHLADFPIPTADEPRYERVHRVLRRYDEHLTEEEREFLKLFSVFRLPVQESAFEKVFEPLLGVRATHQGKLDSALSKLFKRKKTTNSIGGSPLQGIVNRLVTYRLIRHDEHEKSYTTHPLIRNHYFALFTKDDPSQEKAAHELIKDYYISIAGDTPQYPTLDDLKSLIEVVYHMCRAGAYQEALDGIHIARIYQGNSKVIVHQLGAYDTNLSLMLEYFPDGDTTKEPQLNDADDKRWILGEIGFCLLSLGRLRQAVPFNEQAAESNIEGQNWINAGMVKQNLASLYTYLGELEVGFKSALQALDLVRRVNEKWHEGVCLAQQGCIIHLLGDLKTAASIFIGAEKLYQEHDASIKFLYSLPGIQHADHLQRAGQYDYARRVTEANLQACERSHFAYTPGMCHRVLGDLDAKAGNYDSGRLHYDIALKRARSESYLRALIEALLARGRFFAKHMKDSNAAFSDLNEALGYCVESGYRIYEADVRVALAWAYLANGEKEKARQFAERALQMSNEMGYHWGKVDAEEVLVAVSG